MTAALRPTLGSTCDAATLSIAEAGWKKAPDMPGTGKVVLDLANEQITRMREIEVKATGLDGKLGDQLTPDRSGSSV